MQKPVAFVRWPHYHRRRILGQLKGLTMRWLMRSKIHKAIVTQADLNYVGSITIDEDLMDACGLWDGEKVLVVSNTSGARLETYTIAGKRGSGEICMNGAAAHLINVHEEIIIVGFELTDKPIQPKVIMPSDQNRSYVELTEVAGASA
jgi:aspartate 1-decarboxylase